MDYNNAFHKWGPEGLSNAFINHWDAMDSNSEWNPLDIDNAELARSYVSHVNEIHCTSTERDLSKIPMACVTSQWSPLDLNNV